MNIDNATFCRDCAALRAELQSHLAESRPSLPQPLEPAADAGHNPYAYAPADCDECGLPLTEREHAPDIRDDGGCSHGLCADCSQVDNGSADDEVSALVSADPASLAVAR